MSTSDKQLLTKTAMIYACAAAFCAFFGGVYEVFSHQVYSYFMIYAFAIPLALGVIPCLALAFRGQELPGILCRRLYHSGVATLTVGCIYEGVLRIYGTTNRLIWVYAAAGAVLLLGSIAAWFSRRLLSNGKACQSEMPL